MSEQEEEELHASYNQQILPQVLIPRPYEEGNPNAMPRTPSGQHHQHQQQAEEEKEKEEEAEWHAQKAAARDAAAVARRVRMLFSGWSRVCKPSYPQTSKATMCERPSRTRS